MLTAADREKIEPLARAVAEAYARARLVPPLVVGDSQSVAQQVEVQTQRLMSDAEIAVAKARYDAAVQAVLGRVSGVSEPSF